MPARAPIAFFYSVLLHACAVLAIAALAFAFHQNRPPPTEVFELVAGPPTDLAATEAPAPGSPDAPMDIKVPEPPAPRPPPPAQIEPAPSESIPEAAPPKAPAPKRVARPEAKTATESTAAKSEPRMTYEQYVKKFGAPKTTTAGGGAGGRPRAIPVPKVGRGIANGVWGGSVRSTGGGGGTAMTTAEHTAMEGYFARLVAALRQNLEKPPGLSDLLNADVAFYLAADGTISRVRIARSSGNAAFDAACIEAFRRVGSIGPTPSGKSDDYVVTFRMKDE
jgi:colicin import membrane protein